MRALPAAAACRPSRISILIDQKPDLRDPKAVLNEIGTAAAPEAYLRSLHPKHVQFERLRQALLKARAKGRKDVSGPDIQRIVINMERWRWMPAELGAYHVQDNIPEFVGRVVKNGKSVYVDKVVVGLPKYATPIFSADMRSIVFNPAWTVPETIKFSKIFSPLSRAMAPAPISPSCRITAVGQLSGKAGRRRRRWTGPAPISCKYTFTQAPGPDNVLGMLKFNFPNRHAIYMHDTIQPELFGETVRMASHGCIRVRPAGAAGRAPAGRGQGLVAPPGEGLLSPKARTAA